MYQLVESLKILDGLPCNLEFHNERLYRSGKALFGLSSPIDLDRIIVVPEKFKTGLVKCRVIYTNRVLSVEFQHYRKKTVSSIKIVHDDRIDYTHKLVNRDRLNELLENSQPCDDILIIKKGQVTDGFASNLAFYDQNDQKWYTPKSPLLKGTKRAQLLKRRILIEKEIMEQDIWDYGKISLINAMVDLEEIEVATGNIFRGA